MSNYVERLVSAIAGRYTIERELGRGGMATVYLAHDVKHHREVAVKVLDPELTAAIGTARFLREIETAARLHHPHILPLHDSGDADGMLYYVMPYVEGESLHDRLRRQGQLAVDEAVRIAREVADALAYAHARGVLHRDIKPANIMLEAGHAMVMDFGVALRVGAAGAERLTLSGVSPGTPLYMSPEQATGDAHVDERSDIYSLGCVLYEMLTGDPPFTASSNQAVLARKLAEPVPSVRIVRDTVSPALERVVWKALARTPADRFRSAAELAHALDAVALEQAASDPLTPAGTPSGGHAVAVPWAPGPSTPATGDGRSVTAVLARFLAVSAGALALLTAIGLVTTILYDVVMRIPSDYTPSRKDFPVIGTRALIPVLITGFLLLLAFVLFSLVLRFLGSGLRRSRHVRQPRDALRRQLRGLTRNLGPATVADLYFLGTVAVSILVLLGFQRRTAIATSAWASTDILSCAHLGVHRNYTIVLTALIMALAFLWWRVSRYFVARNARGGRIALARWGGLAWLVIVVLAATAPWRLRWHNERPRAWLNGERVYILLEKEADLVLYNATRRTTQQYRIGDTPELERLGSDGYVFEDEAAFTGPRPGC